MPGCVWVGWLGEGVWTSRCVVYKCSWSEALICDLRSDLHTHPPTRMVDRHHHRRFRRAHDEFPHAPLEAVPVQRPRLVEAGVGVGIVFVYGCARELVLYVAHTQPFKQSNTRAQSIDPFGSYVLRTHHNITKPHTTYE